MNKLHITDHALLRALERLHGIDTEKVRRELEQKAARAHAAAQSIGGGEYSILIDGVRYRCCNDRVVTVFEEKPR